MKEWPDNAIKPTTKGVKFGMGSPMSEATCLSLIEEYTSKGWRVFYDNERSLCFTKYVDKDHEWVEDYNKKDGRLTRFNGRQKINIRMTNGQEDEKTSRKTPQEG